MLRTTERTFLVQKIFAQFQKTFISIKNFLKDLRNYLVQKMFLKVSVNIILVQKIFQKEPHKIFTTENL